MTEQARNWQRHLDRWQRSGLSQAEFCRKHGLKAGAFSRWKRKLLAEATTAEQREPSGQRAISPQQVSSPARVSSPKQVYSGSGKSSTSRTSSENSKSWTPAQCRTPNANFVEVHRTTCSQRKTCLQVISPALTAYEVVLPSDVVIRLPANYYPDTVSQLIAVVKASC